MQGEGDEHDEKGYCHAGILAQSDTQEQHRAIKQSELGQAFDLAGPEKGRGGEGQKESVLVRIAGEHDGDGQKQIEQENNQWMDAHDDFPLEHKGSGINS